MPTFDLHVGDCIEVLRGLPAESVDAVVTSPPYADQRKSSYGGIPEADYPAWTVAWMDAIKPVLKPEGSVLLNISPHVKGGNLSDYVLRTRLALRDAGWLEPDELIWIKPNAMPAGSPDKPRRSWESILWFSRSSRAYSNAKANGEAPKGQAGLNRTTAQKAGWAHHRVGANSLPEKARCSNVVSVSVGERNNGFHHPAPFPTALATWCVNLITPPGGIVLDPFNGSGTTGIAAHRGGDRHYLGIDTSEEYIDMTWERYGKELDLL